jgi:phage tail-like protein
MPPISAQLPVPTIVDRADGLVDPVPAYAFYVEIDNIIEASFTGCSGLSVTRESEDFFEGGLNDRKHWLHGRVSYGKITLNRGIAHSDELWLWFVKGADSGFVEERTVTILQMIPYTDKVVRRYNLEKAFPTQWSGPSLDTGSNDVAVETLEIAFSKFTLVKG